MSWPALPMTRAWGVRLAFGTAIISGCAVWLNASAVRAVGDPAVYTTLKNLVAALILIVIAATAGGGREVGGLSRGQWSRLLVIGAIGGSLPFLLFFTGLSMATATDAAFLHKTLFLWVALWAVPFLGERLGAAQVAALAVLLLGQVLVIGPSAGGSIGVGEVMILAATVLWSIEVVVAKRLLVGVSPAVVGAARLGFGVLLLAGYLALTGKVAMVSALSMESMAWVLLTGVLLAGYVGTWLAALQRSPATVVTAVLVIGVAVTAMLDSIASGAAMQGSVSLGLVVIGAAATWMAATARQVATGPTTVVDRSGQAGSASA